MRGRAVMNTCWLFHSWGKWEQYVETGRTTSTGILVPKDQRGVWRDYREYRQKRCCKKCGKVQDEEVTSS